MGEEKLLENIFDPVGNWENDVRWCDLCSVFYISCPECKNSSCNGGGCDFCHEPFKKFNKKKHGIEDYLNEEEERTYVKIQIIKHKMGESLRKGNPQLSEEEIKMINY